MDYNNKKKEFFDEFAERYLQVDFSNMRESSKIELKAFLEFFNFNPGAKVIELGCGGGRFVIPLLMRKCKVTGVDISQKSLDVLKNNAERLRLASNLTLLKNDFSNPPYKAVFDVAYMVSTIHQLDETAFGREKIVTNLATSLKPGGELCIFQPNSWSPFWYLARFHPDLDWKIEKHCLRYSFLSLRKLYLKMGFKDIQLQHFSWFPMRLVNKCKFIELLNKFLCRMPIVKYFSLFVLIKGTK